MCSIKKDSTPQYGLLLFKRASVVFFQCLGVHAQNNRVLVFHTNKLWRWTKKKRTDNYSYFYPVLFNTFNRVRTESDVSLKSLKYKNKNIKLFSPTGRNDSSGRSKLWSRSSAQRRESGRTACIYTRVFEACVRALCIMRASTLSHRDTRGSVVWRLRSSWRPLLLHCAMCGDRYCR